MTRRRNNKHFVAFCILALILGAMSLGFAAYRGVLTVNGRVLVEGAKPELIFDAAGAEGSKLDHNQPGQEAVPERFFTVDSTRQHVTANLTLARPGFRYTAHIPVKNIGNANARLSSVTHTELSVEQREYLSYKVTLREQGGASALQAASYKLIDESKTPGSLSALPIVLEPEKQNTYLLEFIIDYFYPQNAHSLPKADTNMTIEFNLNFEQAS